METAKPLPGSLPKGAESSTQGSGPPTETLAMECVESTDSGDELPLEECVDEPLEAPPAHREDCVDFVKTEPDDDGVSCVDEPADTSDLSVAADWINLPDLVVAQILSYLTVEERYMAGGTCRNWRESLDNPKLWKSISCGFFLPRHQHLLKCILSFGQFVSHLTISLDQKKEDNRIHAIHVIELITKLSPIRLSHLTVQFKGDNPLFYGGQEFLSALTSLFVKIRQQPTSSRFIRYLNFREMQANIDDDFIVNISDSCPNLEYFNILNSMLVCKVRPESMMNLVRKCKKLKELHLFHTSLVDEVFITLAEPGRQSLRKLGVVCRRDEKYGEDISSSAWAGLVAANPDLKVELGFDHTCPLHRVSEILKAEIPVTELYFATYSTITYEVQLARKYFEHSLESLVVLTKPNLEFEYALLDLVRYCRKLDKLLVYGVLRPQVIDEILNLSPRIKQKGSYILKSQADPESMWTVGEEEDYL